MGLFDKFKKKEAPAAPVAPAAIEAEAGPDVLCSPIRGKAIKMATCPIRCSPVRCSARAAPCGPRTRLCTPR